ncbi:hypothetical protein AMTR_s00059p00175720 [Amborella trichopoda]|uniref:DC1 domain-containing protein n=2 Tax=Amborella trichopoda TaxID=13333 RepID=U5D891_AMBTC|nr:hypothetical protein AMTR_s00059p00175720 [Amborella trichopoda]
MVHPSHPQHKLKFEHTDIPFKCDGCKEAGIGSKYKCDICDFDLHLHCALASQDIYHPFYRKCTFQFHQKPPGELMRYCNACGKDVLGFVYHCKRCGYDLHPCCAKLPHALDDGEIRLFLYRKVSSSCHKCGRKGPSWSYRSPCKKYNLHVSCVKEMLVEIWQEIYFSDGGKKKSLEFHTRIPSLKGMLHNHHKSKKGKVRKCCEMAGTAVQFIISAVLGDPSAVIAAVIGAFMSR